MDGLDANETDWLVPVIAGAGIAQAATGEVLMFAWMNRESLALTVQEGRAVYWSRSRGKLWRKGEESGTCAAGEGSCGWIATRM
jgi:phosphoribosyl-AMP cyclohydrolase